MIHGIPGLAGLLDFVRLLRGVDRSPDVRDFFRERLETPEHLELLLLLRSEPNRFWTIREIARALKIAPQAAFHTAESLRRHSVVESGSDGRIRQYKYQPARDTAPEDTRPKGRPRESAIQSFSDAFRVDNRKKNG